MAQQLARKVRQRRSADSSEEPEYRFPAGCDAEVARAKRAQQRAKKRS